MNFTKERHPSPRALEAFSLGQLSAPARASIERHLADCDSCCVLLQGIPDDSLVDRLRRVHQAPNDNLLASRWQQADTRPVGDAIPAELIDHPRYRVIRVLGWGGMGVVYQAEHRLMERTVALKVINREFLTNPTALDRFRREVKAAGQLLHPNIITAHDADQAGDLHFLVMELVDGISLARLVEDRGPLAVGQACHYARQTAQGLQHAFEHGMVHRDIKPQNLMLTCKGQVKILDFGLARLLREQNPKDAVPLSGRRTRAGLTAAGAVLGTPDYIAPEQASDACQVDHRADIYSLGCTLYFLLTGHAPFPGGSAQDKLLSHRDAEPKSVSELRTDVPSKLDALLRRMMAKDPGRRYQTAAEVDQALTPFADGAELSAAAMAPSTRGVIPGSESSATPSFSREPPASAPVAIAGGSRLNKAGRPRGEGSFLRSPLPWLVATASIVTAVLLTSLLRPSAIPVLPSPRASVQAEDPGPAVLNVPPAAQHTRVLMVVPQHLWYPDYGPVRRALEDGGVQVQVASSALSLARPVERGPFTEPTVKPDLLLEKARAEDYEAVVFTGGMPIECVNDPRQASLARKLIEEMLNARPKKYVASLDTGTWVLMRAGVLAGRDAAGDEHIPYRERMSSGAKWHKQPVVVSDHLITGGDFKYAEEFARELLKALRKGR